MKLESNMYIRDTRKGKIYKLTDFDLDFRPQKTTYDFEKASHNITDLIEVGDYVNGFLVDKSRYGELYVGYVYCGGVIQRTTEAYVTFISDMRDEDIKTILTKEQFENNCYKIGDE